IVAITTAVVAFSCITCFGQDRPAQGGPGNGLEARVSLLEIGVAQLQTRLTTQATNIASLQTALSSAQTTLAQLQKLLFHFSRRANDIYITGANLHVVNGLGTTDTTNGYGNIIVGYNEVRPPGLTISSATDRSGSHMVIVGTGLNYSSFGGIVAGRYN